MKAKYLLVLIVFSSLIQSCIISELLPVNPLPARVLEVNDKYDVIWSLPNITIGNCTWRPMMVSTPGKIFFEGNSSMVNAFPTLMAIDSLSGELIWQLTPSSAGAILADSDILYRATNGEAVVQAFDASNGNLLWETRLPWARSAVGLYFTDNKIFVNTVNNKFFILNNQGKIIDQFSSGADVYVEMDGILYFKDSYFRAINLASQSEIWHLEIGNESRSSPVFYDRTIFLRTANADGFIYSIDQSTGNVNWKEPQRTYSNLYVADEKMYFISYDGYLVSIDRYSGAEFSKVKFSTPFDSSNYMGDYCIIGDPTNDVLVVAFSDNNQILGLKIKRP